jgi:glycosyltransferase involved in cell wall biosynthesis
MNICILTQATLSHQMGGTEVHCQTICRMAVRSGHNVTVITTRHPRGIEYEETDGAKVYYLANTRPGRFDGRWGRESSEKLIQLHRAKRFDVVWAENLCGYYYAWKVRPRVNIPVISIIQSLGIVGHIASEFNRLSSFSEARGFFLKYLPEAIFHYIPWFYLVLRYSDAVIGISDETVKDLKKEFGVNKDKTFIVYDGIDTQVFSPDEQKRKSIRDKFGLCAEDKLVMMSGVVYKQKGMHIGLSAFAGIRKDIPDAKMMIVGEGPQLAELKVLAGFLGVSADVIFTGLIRNEETSWYYNACDVLLVPTLRAEGLCIVAVEGMSCARPVVISAMGGTRSTIDDGVSGFFVRPKDINALGQKLRLLLKDPPLCRKMGLAAREKALARFSQTKMIEEYFNICGKIINP